MPQNPYTPRILELSAKLSDLQDEPAGPMFTPEEIAARKAQQLKDEQLSILGKLSGDKQLETVGAALLPHALKAAEPRYTEHGEFNPVSGDMRVFPEYQRRIREDRAARELAQTQMRSDTFDAMAPYKDAAAALQAQRAELVKAQTSLAEQKLAQGKPITGQAYKDVKRLGDDAQNLAMVRENFNKNFTETASGVTPYGELQDRIAAAIPGFAPDSWVKNRAAWADLQRLKEMKARYDLFGATLTGHEKTSWQSVTPPRGATKEQLKDWFDEQYILLNKAIKRGGDAAAAGGYNPQQIEELTNGVWKSPTQKKGLTAEQQAELDQLEKELGGGR